ncbi:PLA2G16 [Mytilus coruscus]|uniref:PLA2G16 n=1 Tax=Mytilus coruscus TaxID=42192 RepID=A0A6J8EY29_MYTCO|nr:PLA2G16 [Mytilus coruscus]
MKNTNDVEYYNVSGETSDLYDECREGSSEDEKPVPKRKVRRKTKRRTLGNIKLWQGSRYSAISIKPYKAKTNDELDFPKEVKFDVVGQETERWLIGEIDRRKGFFPAEYVKRIQLPGSTRQTTYIVIATKSYKAKSSSQISFQKEDKFTVVGEKSFGWLIGEINGKKGFFPSECLKIKRHQTDIENLRNKVMAQRTLKNHNRFVVDSLEEGDLIQFDRGIYSHWAVYAGDEKVIHLTGIGRKMVSDPGHSISISDVFFNRAVVMIENFWTVAGNSKATKNNSNDRRYR